jgi:hypothetical protein
MTRIGRVNGYAYAPQNLEVIVVIHLLPELMQLPQIVGYVHDNDAKTQKVIRDSGWGIQEFLDPGHAGKSFQKAVQKASFNEDISSRLRRWMRQLLREPDLTKDQKLDAWRNTIYHLTGYHENCPFSHGPVRITIDQHQGDLIALVIEFLRKTERILECCDSGFTTQINESFNRAKLKYATKDQKWGFPWDARMVCSVLDRNRPSWKLNLVDRLALPPIAAEVRLCFEHDERLRLGLVQRYQSDEYIKARKQARQAALRQKRAAPLLPCGYTGVPRGSN